jgi:hypothetical protein
VLKGLPAPVTVYEVDWEPVASVAPEAAADPGVVLPDRLRRPPPFGFFGREAERTALAERWKEALTGRGQVVLLSGEPGIGKTALTAEFARGVHADGAVVLYGRCDEDLGFPYQAFVEALRDVPLETRLRPPRCRSGPGSTAGRCGPCSRNSSPASTATRPPSRPAIPRGTATGCSTA